MSKPNNFIFIIFLLWGVQGIASGRQAKAEHHILIKYTLNRDATAAKPYHISKYIMGIVSGRGDKLTNGEAGEIPSKRTVLLDMPGKEVVLIDYTIDGPGLYVIKDLFGHEIMLDDSMIKDTLELMINHLINKPADKVPKLNDSIASPWTYSISYPRKYMYMGFFDSLSYIHQDLRVSVLHYSFRGMHEDLSAFLAYSRKVYADRLNYLEQFTRRYYMPAKLKYYAFKEIQYAYYYDLINPLTGYPSKISSYPKDALDTIEAFGKAFNDNDLLDHCLLFKLVLRDYALYYPFAWSPTSALPNDEKNYIVVRERVAWYDSYLKGEAKNYAMVNLMQFISQFNDKSDFELAFSHYDSLHSNAGILAIRDSLNHLVNQIGSISAKELLQLMVEDTTHHKTSLRTYFIKKLTLIDCWATWCAPCKRQMPFLAAIAAEFKDKVTFISLSANQMLPKWNDWMLKNGDILSPNIIQAHAPGGFNHPFFKRLMVSSIPRYILVSQEGEILNRSMPNPEDKAAFINELNHYFEEVSHI